jgi:hypothetical protein
MCRNESVLCFIQSLRANIETLAIKATVSTETSVHGVLSPTTAVLTNAMFVGCKIDPYKINDVMECYYLIHTTNSKADKTPEQHRRQDTIYGCFPLPFSVSLTHCYQYLSINPLTPKLNSSAQHCLTRFFTGDLASWTVHFVNICVKTNTCNNYSFSC